MFDRNPARAAALAEGRQTYAGRPCKRCREAIRYVSSNGCTRCASTRARQRRAAGLLPPQRYKLRDDTVRGVAFAAGRKTFDGRQCTVCGGTERYTSSGECGHCARMRHVDPAASSYKRSAVASIPLRPVDGRCQCCGAVEPLVVDHDHTLEVLGFPGDLTFRGWICHGCNQGIGRLGDNIAGVTRALDYLKRAAKP